MDVDDYQEGQNWNLGPLSDWYTEVSPVRFFYTFSVLNLVSNGKMGLDKNSSEAEVDGMMGSNVDEMAVRAVSSTSFCLTLHHMLIASVVMQVAGPSSAFMVCGTF